MQPYGTDQNMGAPPYQNITPEQMLQWQQMNSAFPQSAIPPEMIHFMQQQGIAPQQITPEMVSQWQYQVYQMQMQQNATAQPPINISRRQANPYQKRRGPQARRRERGGVRRFFLTVFCIGAIGFGAWYFWQQGGSQRTAVIQMGQLGTIYRGDALIVRNEITFDDEGVQNIQYVALEGEVVSQGEVICYVYSTGYNSREKASLQGYRDQIKNYQRTLLKGQAQSDPRMEPLERGVIDCGKQVRSLVQGSSGDLINMEGILDHAILQRQEYFRARYSTDMRLNRLYDDEETQLQRINSWITQKHASRAGLVSFYTDGFEIALSRDTYELFSPMEVRAMINGQKPEISMAARGRTSIYRLVREQDYAVLMLVKDSTWNPVQGSTYKLRLEQFSNTVVDAQILSFTRSGGELLLRLAVMGDVKPVLYMRTCQAELGEYADCMLVPSAAIYEQGGAKGVVIVDGEEQRFVPVRIIEDSGGNAYISAIQTGVLQVGQTVRLF